MTDEDRWPWLRAIAAWMDERIAAGESDVLGCSALKRSYRDVLLGGRPQAQMIFLEVAPEELARRLAARYGTSSREAAGYPDLTPSTRPSRTGA